MNQKRVCTIIALVITIPIQGGHLRNKSISLQDLSNAYRIETIETLDHNAPSGNRNNTDLVEKEEIAPQQQTLIVYDIRQNTEWSHSRRPFHGENNFCAIQQEIAQEMARRSPLEKIRYLESIAALVSRYPNWLDFIHGEAIEQIENRSEHVETPYSLFVDTLREICLEN